MTNIHERLDNLRVHIQTPEFLEGKGLSNEVNIRIFCYDPKEEQIIRHFVEQITNETSPSEWHGRSGGDIPLPSFFVHLHP